MTDERYSREEQPSILDHEQFDDFLDSLVSRRDPVKPKAGLWNEMGGSLATKARLQRHSKYYKKKDLKQRQHFRSLIEKIKELPEEDLLSETSGSSSSEEDGFHSSASYASSSSYYSGSEASDEGIRPRDDDTVTIDTVQSRVYYKQQRQIEPATGDDLGDSISVLVNNHVDAFKWADEPSPSQQRPAKKIAKWIQAHQRDGGMSSGQLANWISEQQMREEGGGFDYWRRLYGATARPMPHYRNRAAKASYESPESRQQKHRALKLMYLSLAIASFMGFAYYIEHYKVNGYAGVEYFGETSYAKIRRQKELQSKEDQYKNPYEIHVRGKTYVRGEKGYGEKGYSMPIIHDEERWVEKVERLPNIIKEH
mmetsp:Transcript_487/g.724  ORF Transcript_487/g.724 Transcript_487/m.724 type:complete len:368 (+) Transcript_487:84-1187(+)